eukprot:9811909-Alexandrium_andersonii.AAC.1
MATLIALQATSDSIDNQCARVVVYTDGSACNSSTAGWGIAVATLSSSNKVSFRGAVCWPVVLHEQAGFVGAPCHSSTSAELTAALWRLAVAFLVPKARPCCQQVTIESDSAVALQAMRDGPIATHP